MKIDENKEVLLTQEETEVVNKCIRRIINVFKNHKVPINLAQVAVYHVQSTIDEKIEQILAERDKESNTNDAI